MSLICRWTENFDNHWVCTGLYRVDFINPESKLLKCECKCHEKEDS